MSETSNKTLIPFSKIIHISKQVTEEITPKYFKNFLKTTLAQENISLSKESYIFNYFIKEANRYEIYLFKSSTKEPILEFQLFENYPIENFFPKKFYLFITHNFFTVYQDNKPLFTFENKHYSKDDITKFIAFTHKIIIDEVIIIEDDFLETLKSTLDNIKPLSLEKYTNFNSYFYFIGYLIFIFGLVGYLYIENNQPKIEENQKIKQFPFTNKAITKHLAIFLEKGYSNKIEFEKLQYNKKLDVTLKAKHENLQKFLSYYKKATITKLEKTSEDILIVELEIEF